MPSPCKYNIYLKSSWNWALKPLQFRLFKNVPMFQGRFTFETIDVLGALGNKKLFEIDMCINRPCDTDDWSCVRSQS